jgi:hypothetical protein
MREKLGDDLHIYHSMMCCSLNDGEFFGELFEGVEGDVEVEQFAVVKTVDQAVNAQFLTVLPCLLDEGSAGDVEDLLLYVDLNQ